MTQEAITFISPGDSRLDVLLSEHTPFTRSRLAKLIEEGYVTVNGICVKKAGMKPPPGATVSLTVPEITTGTIQAENLPLDILYQDEDIAVVIKPSGMVVHPANGNESHTLVNALMHHITDLSGIGGEMRPGIVHRLDKDTSGLLLIAKNDDAHVGLSAQLQKRQMEKHYRAVVEGQMKAESGTIDTPIGRSQKDRKRMAVDVHGRPSLTHFQLLENFKQSAYLDVHIITGRTHQIRVHMASIHHPVAGDTLYGFQKGISVPRLMLHAYSLSFTHPKTNEPMAFIAPLPQLFESTLMMLNAR